MTTAGAVRTASLLALCLSTFACNSSPVDGEPARYPGKADDFTAAAPDVTGLVNLLSTEDAFLMPPIGERYHANGFNVTVETVAVAEQGFATTAKAVADEAIGRFYDNLETVDPELGLFNFLDSDIHVMQQQGWESPDIEAHLLSLLDGSVHDDVAAILGAEDMVGQYVQLDIYDLGSEIAGTELILFQPYNSTVAVKIRIRYFQG